MNRFLSREALFVTILGLSSGPLFAADSTWRLAFEDHFERTELGPDWSGSTAQIREGRLLIKGPGGRAATITRGFAADVKVEFTAEADPERPPCDLSVGLGAGPYLQYSYLLGFGARSNRANHILGASRGARDDDPPFLIEPGKTYHLVAIKEGHRLEYHVNGQKILEAYDDDPTGGPGLDRICLITWNGMYVDDVKVYERTTPAPDGPLILKAMPALGYTWQDRVLSYSGDATDTITRAIEAYNARRYAEARDLFASVSPPTLASVAGLAYVIGDVGYQERPGDQERLAELAAAVAKRASAVETKARDFAQAAKWFAKINIRSRDRRSATRLIMAGPENNPFYHKSNLFMARYVYASGLEGANRDAQRQALKMFAALRAIWPEHEALRQFGGEKIAWGPELIRPETDGPAWARYLQECLARQHAILNWWFTQRQAPDGQLGGGWGDDVELMRSWVPVACITSAGEPAIAGIERLAEGVWQHVLVDGFDPGIGDVEHQAEPSCDTLPHLILLRYGDPLWVERNLRSAKTIREKFMGVNERGFLHFISTEFGTNGVYTHFQAGGDTGYHARATKHFIWLGWYGVPEARDAFLQWCDGWRDVTLRKIGTKPAGFAPASVFFPSGSIDPPNGKPWYDDNSHYYGFPGLATMVHESFLTAAFLSGDRKYLDPFQTMMELSTMGPLRRQDPSKPPDDINNLLAMVAHQSSANLTAVYKWLTHERVYDEYTLRFGSPTQRYLVNYDLDAYSRFFEGLAHNLRYNWAQRTSEVLQTDRAGLQGAWDVLGAYTGAVRNFVDSATPTMAVTWDTPDLNFAAMVTENMPERLRIRLYNFNQQPMHAGLRPWLLLPGDYVLRAGEPVPGEYDFQKRYRWQPPVDIAHRHRGEPIQIEIPSRTEWVVDLRLRKAYDQPAELPDLAIHERDVRIEGGRVRVTVHNIGGAEAGPFEVIVRDAAGREAGRTQVDGLPAIHAFEPVKRDVEVALDGGAREGLRVSLDPAGRVEEICEENNHAAVRLKEQ